MIDKQKIGNTFFLIRKEKRLTQIDFANLLNISQQTLSLIEKGKILPSLEILDILTKKYCISFEYILGIDNQDKKNCVSCLQKDAIINELLNTIKLLREKYEPPEREEAKEAKPVKSRDLRPAGK